LRHHANGSQTKKKPSEKEASGDGDGFEAILSVGVGQSPSLSMKRKSLTKAKTKSKVAGSKKKTSNATASTSEEPSSPESDGRKCLPEQMVALEKQKGKVITLWQWRKPKRVVVSDVPTGKDTGPPPNKNGVSFRKQCNVQCLCPLSTPCKLCCDIETHVSLNNVGEYVVFPAETVHQGFFSAVKKIVVQAQLFCGYSNSAELPRVNRSSTLKMGIQTGTITVSSELSSSVLMNWECDYPLNKFKPPKDYKLTVVDTDKNWVVERDQLKDCEYLSKLMSSFEEVYVWLEVKSVLLIWKQKVGAGFQNWHVDLAKNGQTVYTICVNIGSLDIRADSGDIDYLDVNDGAYAPDIDVDDEGVKESYVGDSKCEDDQASLGDKEGVAKSAFVARSLEYSDDEAYIDTIKGDSDNKFRSSFPRDPSSRNFILGGPQKPDMMGMTAVEEEVAKKQYRKSRKSFTNKQRLALMKSMSNKGVSTLPQKSQQGLFTGDPNKMVRLMEYVESHCLLKGHTFQLKETLQIHIAGEANLRLIKVKTIRRDSNNLIVDGRNFYICATYSVQCGWQVSKACCREGDNFSIIPQNHRVFKEKGLQAPFKSKWVSHLLWNTIEETPGLPYQIIRKLLKPHVNEYVLTNNVLQES
jgi:hypothetical protein